MITLNVIKKKKLDKKQTYDSQNCDGQKVQCKCFNVKIVFS